MSALSTTKSMLAVLTIAGSLTACQTVSQPEHEGHAHWFHHHGPRHLPPEIAQACAGKNAGDAVTITLQNGKTIQGTCALRFKPDFKRQSDVPPAPIASAAQPTPAN